MKNTGQLPMYLLKDNHEGIVSRDTFHAVQAEFARRNAGRFPTQKLAPTGRSCYSAKYALTERLICGDCGTMYRRCVWVKQGKKQAVWRCSSRMDYGKKYCKDSPTIYEKPLQRAILAAINSAMSQREVLIGKIADAMRFELAPSPGEEMSIAAIDQRLSELEGEFKALFGQYRESGDYAKYADAFKQINDSMAELKEKRALLLEQQKSDSAASRQVNDAISILNTASPEITEWDESMIRQLVDAVKVLSVERIRVYLRGGMEIEQELDKERD